jgi:hypothetical protein
VIFCQLRTGTEPFGTLVVVAVLTQTTSVQ